MSNIKRYHGEWWHLGWHQEEFGTAKLLVRNGYISRQCYCQVNNLHVQGCNICWDGVPGITTLKRLDS